jgi:lipid A ethanolaminephosphotransferase
MSDGYRRRAGIDDACLRRRAAEPASHDDLYHTVLGALGLRSAAYQPKHDLLAGCRRNW